MFQFVLLFLVLIFDQFLVLVIAFLFLVLVLQLASSSCYMKQPYSQSWLWFIFSCPLLLSWSSSRPWLCFGQNLELTNLKIITKFRVKKQIKKLLLSNFELKTNIWAPKFYCVWSEVVSFPMSSSMEPSPLPPRHPHYFPSSSPHFSHKNQPLLSSMTTDQKVDLSFVSSHLHDSHTWIKSWYNKNFWPVFGPVFTPIPSLTYILLALIHFTSRPFTKRWLLWLNGLIGSNGRWHRAQRGN